MLHPLRLLVYAVVDDSLSRHLLGDSVEVFVRREDAERFIEEVRGDEPELAEQLRIEERELEAGRGSGLRRGHGQYSRVPYRATLSVEQSTASLRRDPSLSHCARRSGTEKSAS